MTKARDLANSAAAFAAVSATELGYVDGVTSAIQTQIDGKQAINANVSTTELGYLDGVTSAIQTQLDAKIAKTLTTTTGDIIYASGANTPARLGIGSSAQVLTVSGGIPAWATASSTPTFVGCSLTQSTDSQTINNATWTAVTFDTEAVDTNAFHSTSSNTSRITIPTGYAGKYQVNYSVSYGTGSATGLRYAQIYKNGATYVGSATVLSATTSANISANNSLIMVLAEADYIEAYIYQSSGSSMAMDRYSQSFSVQYLGA
jgi:hypothetical protein